ncbi:rubredoxin [Synechococcus sp. ATX 2A4]|uniref:rubredoxin n=1 Tax=Synechococcus sp. ATX 2A4 TaxID=2823727 RepID=UPI0020CEE367|nr:rubredoxin [Synechococcus sp. ATX 2A4]MCP9885554.1 rubredoxin [Synechococcus sp. ATX 2A4]
MVNGQDTDQDVGQEVGQQVGPAAEQDVGEQAQQNAQPAGAPPADTQTPDAGPAGDQPPGDPADESGGTDPDTHRFECRSCGFVYDPGEGVRKLAIPAGTPFSSLDPVGFHCPVCRSRVGAFKDIGPRNKPSGFEDNLSYGFGVNTLTPGQKNVLIFGGFALAFAFFLSLYSLR